MLPKTLGTLVIAPSLALVAACSASLSIDEEVRTAVAAYVDAINDDDLERLADLTNCSVEREPALPLLLCIADAHRQLGPIRFDISRVATEPGQYFRPGAGFTIAPEHERQVVWVEGGTWVASDRIRNLAPQFRTNYEGWVWRVDDDHGWYASECG